MSTTRKSATAAVDAVETHTARWRHSSTRYAALFRLVETVAILQHIRFVSFRQRGATTSGLDPAAQLADVPNRELEALRERGYQPTEGRA